MKDESETVTERHGDAAKGRCGDPQDAEIPGRWSNIPVISPRLRVPGLSVSQRVSVSPILRFILHP
jgi:hypothetical protein